MAVRVRGNGRPKNPEKPRFTGEKPSLFLYGGVGLIALLKDLLDLVGIGSLPGIGTIITLCFSFLIWILITVFDGSSHGTRSNIQMARGLVTIFFSLVEALGFGLNFLPIETLMVFVLYVLARRAWKKAKKEAEKKGIPSKSQLRQDRLNAVRQAKEARAQRQISEQQTEEPTQQPVDNEAKAMPSIPLKMMSDMKLPENAVVPKQEVVSGKEITPVTGAGVKSPRPTATHFGPTSVSSGGVSRNVPSQGGNISSGEVSLPKTDHQIQQMEAMKYEREIGVPLLREAQARKNKILENRGALSMSKEDFDRYFSTDEFAVHEGLQQQNVGDCYAVAAIHAFSQSPSFEMMVRSSTKRLPDGSWEVKLPLLDKNAQVITILPEEIQDQKNPGFLKRHGGIKRAGGILPDLRKKLNPVKANEGIRVLEAAYIKSKFGHMNRLSAEGGFGDEVLLQLGGSDNFLKYRVSSASYNHKEKKWEFPGLSALPEEYLRYIDHMLETFDPDVFIATTSTKHFDTSKLSGKILHILGLDSPFYEAVGTNKKFVAGHSYSLTKVDKERKMVTLTNPWDTRKPVELTFQQFKETFSAVNAVRINHKNLLGNMESLYPEKNVSLE